MIKVENSSIRKAINKITEEYKHISGDVLNNAISRTINRAADSTKTVANQEIRKKYNISQSRVNKDFSVRKSNKSTLTAYVVAKGSPMPLTQFQAKQVGKTGTTTFDRKGVASSRLNRKSRSNAIKGVSATIRKGESINIPFAFIQVSNSGITVFARGKYEGNFKAMKERLPITKVTTAAVPLMFAGQDVMEPTLRLSQFDFEKRFEHELKNLIRT